MKMHLYKLYGEDTPHTQNQPPFKTWLIIAPDDETARAYAPAQFRVDLIVEAESLEGGFESDGPSMRCGWVGGNARLVEPSDAAARREGQSNSPLLRA